LVGAGAVSVTGKIKYTKVITALEKVGVVVDVEKVIAKFGSESKFLKYVDEFGGEAKFTELVKNAGGIDELTRLVDEAGGIEKFLSAVEEAGGLEKYLDNLHPISEEAKSHLIDTEGIVNKKVSGGHNQEKFQKFAQENKIKIVSEKPHPSIPGVKELEYQMPKLDRAGNVVEPIEYRGKPYQKTVYDPSMISDDVMYQWGQEAMRSGVKNKEGTQITGKAKNGLKFVGYLDKNENIKNFHPVIDEKM
ncbi:MAG: CdiA family toxin C-terminal domain-containing protein, partial [Lactococcus garvieae]